MTKKKDEDGFEVCNEAKKEKKGPNFDDMARAYAEARDLKYHRERYLIYRQGRYIAMSQKEAALDFRRWMAEAGISRANKAVDNSLPIAAADNQISSQVELPTYRPDAEDADEAKRKRAAWPKLVIPYRNGLLDVDSVLAGHPRMLDHTPEYVCETLLPYDFDPAAECPEWLKFLASVFGSADDPRALLLQEWMGYTMTPDTGQQKFLLKLGPTRSGKGTIDKVHEAVLGSANCAAFSLRRLGNQRFGLIGLVGKSVCLVGETILARSDRPQILEVLTSIVGGDPVDIEFKQSNDIRSYRLFCRFSISANVMPEFFEPSGALAARMMVINFTQSFVGREDRGLAGRLMAELPGIANWCLAGLVRLHRNGRFTEPDQQRDAILRFRRESSTPFAFAQDCLRVTKACDPGNLDGVTVEEPGKPIEVSRDRLLGAFAAWAGENNVTCTAEMFIRGLKALLPAMTDSRRVVDTGEAGRKKVTFYHGIDLLPGVPVKTGCVFN